MRKAERWLAVALAILALLAVAAIVVGPRLLRGPPPTDEARAPGESDTLLAAVVEVLEEETVDLGSGRTQPYQRPPLLVETGSLTGQQINEGLVRALLGSIGLLMAVPITSFIASLAARWFAQQQEEQANYAR